MCCNIYCCDVVQCSQKGDLSAPIAPLSCSLMHKLLITYIVNCCPARLDTNKKLSNCEQVRFSDIEFSTVNDWLQETAITLKQFTVQELKTQSLWWDACKITYYRQSHYISIIKKVFWVCELKGLLWRHQEDLLLHYQVGKKMLHRVQIGTCTCTTAEVRPWTNGANMDIKIKLDTSLIVVWQKVYTCIKKLLLIQQSFIWRAIVQS